MNKSILLFTALMISLILASCDKDDPDPESPSNVVEVYDDITEVTTWYSDSVYVIRAWDFYVENTLIIQGGTIIKFTDDGPDMTLGSGGTISAGGSIDAPIIFTSFKDDRHGGDTNGDADATAPDVKDWGGISTNDNNGSVFSFCEFYYGGGSTYSSTLEVYGSNIQVMNCTFAHNAGDDASGWYGALDASYAGMGCVISGNTFYDNVRPLSINLMMDINNTNVFTNPDDGSEGNSYNAIFVETIDELNAAISWNETEVPFVIDDNDWWITDGASLTLGNNVVLKFRPDSYIVMDNTEAIINYDGDGVHFTSYKDDSKKGDTNGDGDATSPGNGDWGGIYDNVASSYVSWANILYAQN